MGRAHWGRREEGVGSRDAFDSRKEGSFIIFWTSAIVSGSCMSCEKVQGVRGASVKGRGAW